MSDQAELEEERQFLLESLRDLEREHEAGEIDEDDYASIRDDYTARAAEVLRALERYGEDRPAAASARTGGHTGGDTGTGARARANRRPAPPPSRHSASRRIMALTLVAGFVVVALASVILLATGRDPGGSATGSVPDTAGQRLTLAHQLEAQGQAVEALKLYDEVLKEDPANVEALTYRGWLLKLAGLPDQSQVALEKAISLDPKYPDAHFFRGMLLYQDRQNPAAAIPEFEAYLALVPAGATTDAVKDVLERAKRDLAATSTTATTKA